MNFIDIVEKVKRLRPWEVIVNQKNKKKLGLALLDWDANAKNFWTQLPRLYWDINKT